MEEKVCSNARMCFVGGNEFLEDRKHKYVSFSSIPSMGREDSKEVPVEVSNNLLSEFQNIVSNNVPEGLPSGRSNRVTDAFSRRKTLLT